MDQPSRIRPGSSGERHKSPQKRRSDVADMASDEVETLVHELQVHQVELETQNEQLRNAQLELEEARDRYQELYDFAPVGYITLDRTGVVREANLAAAKLLGVERNALINARLSRFIAGNCQDLWYLYLQRISGSRTKESCELQLARADREPVFVQVEGVAIADESGEQSGVRICLTDVSRRAQLDEELRMLNATLEQRIAERTAEYERALVEVQRDQAWLRSLVETTQDAVVSIDRRSRVVLFNPAAERIFGYDRAEVEGRKVNMLMPEPYAAQHDGYIERYERTREPHAIGRIRTVEGRRRNGEVFPAELSVMEVAADQEVHYAAFIRDISEKAQLQAELIEQERLAVVGATAAMVGHEISNPLNSISVTLQLVERKLAAQPETVARAVAPKLGAIKHEIQRLTELLGDFTSLARKRRYGLEPSCLETICEKVLETEEPRFISNGIRVERCFAPQLARPLIEQNTFAQALINLFKNAVEAMPEGGTLSLRAWNEEAHVVLEIADTGVGVPEGLDIFAPFVSTKEEGTGLGMMIIRKVVADHGGTITYRNLPDKGAVFQVRLRINDSTEAQVGM